MITCNEQEVIELNNENAKELIIDNIACYVLVGGNPGGTEGSVYVFQLEGNELKVFSGNIFGDKLLKERLIGILPQIEIFYESWNFERHRDGWTQLPFVMGHYVFVRDFMANDISDNWKSVEARYHFERLVKGVALTVSQHEDEMRSIMNAVVTEGGMTQIKMDADQKKIVEYLLKYTSAWKDSKGLKAILADCVPDKKVLRNIMINAYEAGIYEELKTAKDFKIVIYKYKKILCEDYGIDEKYANWAIETWLIVCGIEIEMWLTASGVDIDRAVPETTKNLRIAKLTNPEVETMNIDELALDLGVRSYNALKRAGISTVGELLRLSPEEMVLLRNIGRKSFENILEILRSLGCVINSEFVEEYYEQWHKRLAESSLERPRFSYADAYDEFVSKNKDSGLWDFDDVIIHRKLDYAHPYVNTFFCQYDNPPIEIIRFTAKKDGNKYEMRVGVRNLSKETRNQPIMIRYKIETRQDVSHIHDCVDTVTPAPKNQELVIKFEYDGEDKPIFSIIE